MDCFFYTILLIRQKIENKRVGDLLLDVFIWIDDHSLLDKVDF